MGGVRTAPRGDVKQGSDTTNHLAAAHKVNMLTRGQPSTRGYLPHRNGNLHSRGNPHSGSSLSMVLLPQVQLTTVNHSSQKLDGNFRNTQFLSLKLHAILRSLVRPLAVHCVSPGPAHPGLSGPYIT